MLNLKPIFSLVVFLILSCLAVMLWQEQNEHEWELTAQLTEMNADQIRIRIEGLMNARMSALKLLAERWVERTPPDFSQERFLQFAENLYTHYPGFYRINWIDPKGVIRWIFPLDTTEKMVGQNLHSYPNADISGAFLSVVESRDYSISPSTEGFQGGIGFDTFWPLIFNHEVQGYLNASFQVKLIIDTCLAGTILSNFWVDLYEANRLIYSNRNQPAPSGKGKIPQAPREIRFQGKIWRLVLTPQSDIYSEEEIANLPYLLFGIGICVTISLLLYFLIQRMQMYKVARDNALYEVGERKRAEAALKSNEVKLEALLEEVASKNAELETFVYSVSHDLKTPIVTIEGFIGALWEDFGHLISDEGKKYLDYMSEATRKMEALINDLLELSRIGRLNPEKTEFSFSDLSKEVVHALQTQIQEGEVKISVSDNLPVIYGEKRRLVQVMENLLSNAIKYMGKENPSPLIEIGVLNQNHQDVLFVRDNGIGIEKIYFEKIFDVFQRLPSAKKYGEGTGIGLAIVKRIIEHHGGRIWLESEPGKGTTFFFTLRAYNEKLSSQRR